ncbi:MAG: hypothetical protein ACK4WC_16665, partial [Rubrimonas sp.]
AGPFGGGFEDIFEEMFGPALFWAMIVVAAAAALAMRDQQAQDGFGPSSRAAAAWIGRLAPTLGAGGEAASLRAVAAAMARTRPPL